MIASVAARVAPRLLWRYRVRSRHISPDEPEAALLPRLTDRHKISIDVGAAQGAYTALLVPLSKRVIAFEPEPQFAEALRAMFADTPLVEVRQIALSDGAGTMEMRVPASAPWRSTVEQANGLAYTLATAAVDVDAFCLDHFKFSDAVGFIKIDVEGHESAVLRGARETIRVHRPNVLIEVEEQHRPGSLQEVFGFFEKLNYYGHFMMPTDGNKLHALRSFSRDLYQNVAALDEHGRRRGPYVNNFIFTPKS
jgi:FkbM family methyltransferase